MREGKARRQIAAYGRELWDRRLVTGSSGNISIRLGKDRILCTPSGASLRNLEPADLVVTDLTGRPLDAQQRPTSELPLHLCAYRVRPSIRVVLHTHPTFCVVWSACGSVFPRDTVGARETLREVSFTPFHPAGSDALAQVCGAAFSQGVDNVLMERHGLSCIGANLEEAFLQSDLAEEAARIAYLRRMTGVPEGAVFGLS